MWEGLSLLLKRGPLRSIARIVRCRGLRPARRRRHWRAAQSGRAAAADDRRARGYRRRDTANADSRGRRRVRQLPLNQAAGDGTAWEPAKEPAGAKVQRHGDAAIMRIPTASYRVGRRNQLRMISSGTQTRRQLRRRAATSTQAASGWVSKSQGAQRSTLGQRLLRATAKERRALQRSKRVEGTSNPPSRTAKTGASTDRTDRSPKGRPEDVAFKKIPDKQGWDPTPCRANEAR